MKIMQRALSLLLGILLALLLAACGGPTLPETGDRAIESGHNEAAPPEETSAAALSSRTEADDPEKIGASENPPPETAEAAHGEVFPEDPDNMPDRTPVPLSLQNDNSAAHRQEIRYGEIAELKECYELAAEIGNRYGVWIHIGDLVPRWIWDAGNVPQCDPVLVKRALFRMDATMAVYPEGFFDQLVYGVYTRLDFYIVGFSPVGMGYVTRIQEESPVMGAARSCLCLDAEDDVQIDMLPYTLTHEITHLIDWRVQYVAANEEGHLYSDEAWMALNPDGFRYAWDDEGLELEMYDRYYEYFAYSYGAHNPLEDRATLMGELMSATMDGRAGTEYTLPFPCLRKLDFFFRCVRDSFDTTGWPEETAWEQGLWELQNG